MNICKTLLTLTVALTLVAQFQSTMFAQIADPKSVFLGSLNNPIPATLINDNVNTSVPGVMIGWNWGSLPYQANLDVHTNVHHFNSPFSGTFPTDMATWTFLDDCEVTSGIVPGVRLIYDPSIPLDPATYATEFPWYNRLRDILPPNLRQSLDFTHKLPNSLMEGIGIRFQPEIVVQADEYAFTPRLGDNQKAVFGFVVRDLTHGSVPSTTSDVNFHRYVLRQTNVTGPTVVLGESWPDGKFGEWPARREDPQSSPFNGRRMYLAVNLRRLANSDNHDVDDDEPVLRLKIRRLLCSDVAAGTNWADVRFDSVPRPELENGTTQNWENLPTILSWSAQGTDRGRKLLLQQTVGTGPVTEIVITRQMLPHGDDGRPDITILGHMVFDNLPFDVGAIGWDRVNENVLRAEETVQSDDCGNTARIAKLQVQVEYLGNADVAIDWIDLGSDNYTYLMQGYYDRQARAVAEAELLYLDALNDNRPDLTTNRAQIMRWYSRDEGSESRWQAMRHYHLLFDENTVTERNVGHNQLRYDYMFNPSFVWDGDQVKLGPHTIAPYVRQGYRRVGVNADNVAQQRDHLGIEWGMASTEFAQDDNSVWHTLPMDYDLRWSSRSDPNNLVGLPAELIANSPAEAYYPRVWNNSVSSYASGGLQAAYEAQRWKLTFRSAYLFSNKPWVANPWLHSNWSTDVANGFNVPWLTYQRPQTGEETRLLIWSQLILGSKGFIAYWGTAGDSLIHLENYDRPSGFALDVGMGPGIPQPNSIRSRENANLLANFLSAIHVQDTMLSTDFLYAPVTGWQVPGDPNNTPFWQPGMRLGLRTAFGTSYNIACSRLGLNTTAVPREEIYTGQHSTRYVLADIANVVHDNRDLIADLQLRAWHSKGFRTWTQDDGELLGDVVSVDDIRTRHPQRESEYVWPTWESSDSSFVELTLLSIKNVEISDRHVIGVLNRRCNPHDFVEAGPNPIDVLHVDPQQIFRSTASHFNRVGASPDKSSRYRQAGSRMIDIPFRSSNPHVVLHIRELGTTPDPDLGYHPLDTIVGASTGLRVNFLPGEGKLFEVRRLNAYALQQNGHLVHSNQRKMVVFPQAHVEENTATAATDPCFIVVEDTVGVNERGYFRMINGTTARYHRVWHQSGTPPSVWYQRSTPIDVSHESPDAISKTPVLTWEAPIKLSDQVLVPAQVGQEQYVMSNPSSGYPAIVVRYNHELPETALRPEPQFYSVHNGTPPLNSETPYGRSAVAYVVFSAEMLTPPIGQNVQIGIVEAMLPADESRANQVAALAANPPRVIQNIIGSPYNGILGGRQSMWSWGTPMINASADGNWYCWSSKTTNGIGYGFKRPGQWLFEPGKTGWIAPQIQQNTWFSTHPTLNSYSRLHLGERDASIVWQEGTDAECGRAIYYSRVRVAQGGNVENYIVNSFVPAPSISPNVTMLGDNRLRLSDGYGNWNVTNDPNGVYPRLSYPTLFRNLSDYELGVDNTRFDLRLVNHKGERVWWQAELVWPDSVRTLLIRKWVDVEDYHIRGVSQDVVTSGPQQFLTAGDGGYLRHPELSQGEQTTEMFIPGNDNVPNPTGPWWQDSVNCLSFEYTTPGLNGAHVTYSLTYGWDLYGASINHSFDGISTARAILSFPHVGNIYPHAAARYSMTQMPGYSWNRRIQHGLHFYGPNYQNNVLNPPITEWSAGFFKETGAAQSEVVTYNGFATDEWSIAIASLQLDGNENLQLKTVVTPDLVTQGGKGVASNLSATTYASEVFRVDTYRQLNLRAHMLGEWPSGVLILERQSDGNRIDVQLRDIGAIPSLVDDPLSPDVRDVSLALVNGSNDEYKIILSTTTDLLVLPTQHLELITQSEHGFGKEKTGTIRRVIDLKSGTLLKVGSIGIAIHPQPASDIATVVVSMKELQAQASTLPTLKVTDVRGRILFSSAVSLEDILRIDVSTWPAGVYAVHITATDARCLAASTFSIVR